jgi:hypothetical protein
MILSSIYIVIRATNTLIAMWNYYILYTLYIIIDTKMISDVFQDSLNR